MGIFEVKECNDTEIGYELYKRMGFEEVSEEAGIVSMRMEINK